MPAEDPSLPAAPPAQDRLVAMDDDVWRRVVPHLRRCLVALPDDEQDARTRRLVAAPASRLVGGRARRDVAVLLAEGGGMWLDLRRRLLADEGLGRAVGVALAGSATDRPPLPPATAAGGGAEGAERTVARLKDRVRAMKAQRDDARRRAEGETARADREEAARHDLERRVADLEERVEKLTAELERSAEDRAVAVERERRRGAAEMADVTAKLRVMRRERQDAARARAAAEARAAADARTPTPTERRDAPPSRLVPGRPSRLADIVRPGTTEAADALLHAGRLVLVDGYNVTRTHRADLDLESQRRWLVNLAASAVASRRLDVRVVFDGHATPGPGSSKRDRGVQVQFTPEAVTADDDLVFQVEALDPARPVTVVTDDRELRDRLAPYRVDLVPTMGFVGALR